MKYLPCSITMIESGVELICCVFRSTCDCTWVLEWHMYPDKMNLAWKEFDQCRIQANKCVAIHRENKEGTEIENTIL